MWRFSALRSKPKISLTGFTTHRYTHVVDHRFLGVVDPKSSTALTPCQEHAYPPTEVKSDSKGRWIYEVTPASPTPSSGAYSSKTIPTEKVFQSLHYQMHEMMFIPLFHLSPVLFSKYIQNLNPQTQGFTKGASDALLRLKTKAIKAVSTSPESELELLSKQFVWHVDVIDIDGKKRQYSVEDQKEYAVNEKKDYTENLELSLDFDFDWESPGPNQLISHITIEREFTEGAIPADKYMVDVSEEGHWIVKGPLGNNDD